MEIVKYRIYIYIQGGSKGLAIFIESHNFYKCIKFNDSFYKKINVIQSQRKLLLQSISFASRCPEIHNINIEKEESVSFLTILCNINIPKLMAIGSVRSLDCETVLVSDCVIHLSELILKASIIFSWECKTNFVKMKCQCSFGNEKLQLKMKFVERMVAYCQVETPQVSTLLTKPFNVLFYRLITSHLNGLRIKYFLPLIKALLNLNSTLEIWDICGMVMTIYLWILPKQRNWFPLKRFYILITF